MFAKALTIFALVAAAQAGVAYVDQHVGAQSEQNIRSLGYNGISTLSSQSKAVDSAYSSVRRHETRVHNPAVQNVAQYAYAPAQVAYAQPQVTYSAAPAQVAYAQPQVAYAQPQLAYAAAPAVARVAAPSVTYSGAQVARVAQPVAYATQAYAAPAIARVAAPVAVAHPVARAVAAHPAGLLGVAYSAVPEVAHLTFDGFGVHYGY